MNLNVGAVVLYEDGGRKLHHLTVVELVPNGVVVEGPDLRAAFSWGDARRYLMEACTGCGNPIRTAIQKGTGFCSQNCEVPS